MLDVKLLAFIVQDALVIMVDGAMDVHHTIFAVDGDKKIVFPSPMLTIISSF
jgi:hypothetical protein